MSYPNEVDRSLNPIKCVPLILCCFCLILTPRAHGQEYALTIGSSGFDDGIAAATDKSGNAYFGGTFAGTVDLDPDSLVHNLTATSADIYVASYSAAGSLRFAFNIGNQFAVSEELGDMTVDDTGRILLTGRQPFGEIDFDPDSLSQALRTGILYVAAYDTSGHFIFASNAYAIDGGTGTGEAVASDSDGNVYIAGSFAGSVAFGTNPPDSLSSEGGTDVFVAGYDDSGNLLYAFALGGAGESSGLAVGVDSNNNVFVAGRFTDTMTFDPSDSNGDLDLESRTSSGGADMFLASYDPTGVFRFAHTFGAPGSSTDDTIFDLAVDESDNVFVTGQFNGTVDFDPSVGVVDQTATGNGSAFFASYSATGELNWVSVLAGGSSESLAIQVDPLGKLVVSGSYSGTIDLDPGIGVVSFESSGGTDPFMARYTTDGQYSLAFVLESSGLSRANGVALGLDGSIVVTGTFSGNLDVDPDPTVDNRTAVAQSDIFMAQYSSSRIVPIVPQPTPGPDALTVAQAYPNPFTASVTIPIHLPTPAVVSVELFDIVGRSVFKRAGKYLNAGENSVQIRPSIASGYYLAVVTSGSYTVAQVVVKY